MGLFTRLRTKRPSTPPLNPDSPGPSSSPSTLSRPLPLSPSSSSIISRKIKTPWSKKEHPLPSPLLAPPSPQERHSSARNVHTVSAATSRLSPAPARPRASSTLGIPEISITGKRKEKVRSGEFKKEGGILGKLEFEGQVISPAKSVLANEAHSEEGWLDLASDDMVRHLSEAVKESPKVSSAETGIADVSMETLGSTQGDDPLELLESPEGDKKKFWKGKRKARSELDVDRSDSPTPRKVSAQSADLRDRPSSTAFPDTLERHPSPSLDIARPPPVRRISSTLFQNPFHRTASRASIIQGDLDPAMADSSFRLKGFRHISGASQADDGLGANMPHIQRNSIISVDVPDFSPGIKTSEASTNAVPHPPSSFQLSGPRPARPSPSRPPSLACSSVGDDVSYNKITAAAFRKGIRRPSEGRQAMSEHGHAPLVDVDDVPLGLLAMRRGEEDHANSSALSLSSMNPRDEEPPRATSPSSGIIFNVVRHQRNLSGGFVVKSATTTRTSPPPDETLREMLPLEALMASPSSMSATSTGDKMSHTDSYFPPQRVSTPLLRPRSSSPFAASVSPKTRPRSSLPPPPEPIHLPQPGDETPSSILLPLPPDQMPDSPVAITNPHAEASSSRINLPSPSGIATTLREKVLQGPRILSGIWGSNSEQDDGFDPAFVIESMNAFAVTPQKPKPARTPPPDPATSPRTTLAERLANVAQGEQKMGGPDRPHLGRLAFPDKDSSEGLTLPDQPLSAVSDSTTASPTTSAAPTITNFPRASAPRSTRRSTITNRRASSVGSLSDSEDIIKRPLGPRQPGPVKGRPTPRLGVESSATNRATQSVIDLNDRNKQNLFPPKRAATTVESDSSDDEPLIVLRERASRSSLVLDAISPPTGQQARALQIKKSTSSLVTKSTSKLDLGPIVTSPTSFARSSSPSPAPGLRASSRPPPPRSRSPAIVISPKTTMPIRSPSRNAIALPPDMSKSRVDRVANPSVMNGVRNGTGGLGNVVKRDKDDPRKHSPASSQSGITADSQLGYPITPRDSGTGEWDQTGYGPHTPRGSRIEGRDRVASGLSSRTMPTDAFQRPPSTLSQWPNEYDTMGGMQGMAMPMPGPGVMPYDQATMLAMMKQHFQASFMAAAARQCEEEWERASSVSTSQPTPSSSSVNPYTSHLSSMPYTMPYPYPMNMPYQLPSMTTMPYAPGFPMQQNYNYGYSYGPTAHSAFGGEFGPPPFPRNGVYTEVGSPRQRQSSAYNIDTSTSTPSRQRHSSTHNMDTSSSQFNTYNNDTSGSPRQKRSSGYNLEVNRQRHSSLDPDRQQRNSRLGFVPLSDGNDIGKKRESRISTSPPPSSWRESSGDWTDVSLSGIGTPRKKAQAGQVVN